MRLHATTTSVSKLPYNLISTLVVTYYGANGRGVDSFYSLPLGFGFNAIWWHHNGFRDILPDGVLSATCAVLEDEKAIVQLGTDNSAEEKAMAQSLYHDV